MDEESLLIIVALVTVIAMLIVAFLFLWSQQKLLSAIQPGNREMSPGSVWLQLIPVFGIVYQFIVVSRISNSIVNEIESRATDSVILPEMSMSSDKRPLYGVGITYCVLFCCGVFPVIGGIFSLAGFICMIVYWTQLASYRRQIEAVSPEIVN